ncbi:MAG: CehA/McbA family metallohydrolase, partial [Anaerolineae bacterium]|nr:CehA/McbA family metallohydrolase [Anaerolineae bacterium]
RSFVVGRPEETTPGYVPGPLQPGLWHVVFGLYQIRADGCEIELEIEAAPDDLPSSAAAARPCRPLDADGFLLPQLQGVLRPAAGWYRGDLHTHTHHSDAVGSLQDLADAARGQGLDFVAVTDHNTITAWPYLAEVGRDDLLLIPAEEVTSYYGHANAWGSRRWHDFRLRSAARMAEVAAAVRAAGGLFSINHPRSGGPPWELGTAFAFDCLEVWNGHWAWRNAEALARWEQLLLAGRRVIAVGGSDRHQGNAGGNQAHLTVGQPTTWVYAPELSVRGILAGLRAGRVCVSGDSTGPWVELEIATRDGRRAVMGESLSLAPDEAATIQVQTRGAAGYRLRLIVNGETRAQTSVTTDDATLAWPLPAAAGYVRAQIEAPGRADNPLVALSNPIWWVYQ